MEEEELFSIAPEGRNIISPSEGRLLRCNSGNKLYILRAFFLEFMYLLIH